MSDDKARLDWLERHVNVAPYSGWLICCPGGEWSVGVASGAGFNGMSDGDGPTLRDAIDAAMAAPYYQPRETSA